MAGWIKIHRSLLDWEWYDDNKTLKLLIHLNLKVNYKDKKWKGKLIKAGSFVTSVIKLSTELKTTPKTIRVHLKRLVDSGEIKVITTNKNTSITLVKWEQMQKEDDSRANELPTKVPIKLPIKVPTTKEVNNIITKEYNNINIRETEFKNSLQPFLEEFGSDVLNNFYLYWTEKKPKGKKMLFEMQKTFDIKRRLDRWSKNNFGNKEKSSAKKEDAATILHRQLGIIK
jgi:hypothetical protein